MEPTPKKVNAFESVFEAWLNKAGPPLDAFDETASVGSQTDKNNNTDSDVDVDLPSCQLGEDGHPMISSQHREIQNDNKTMRLITKRKTKFKPSSMVMCQAIKRKYFSNAHKHASLQTANSKMRSFSSLTINGGISTRNDLRSERYKKFSKLKASSSLVENYLGAKCSTNSQSYTAPSHGNDCLAKYEVHREDDKSQFKSSVGKFTDSHMSGQHSTEVSPVSDAGYGEDVAVDSEHDDLSRRSNGYHSMEEFQLTSVSPPSQSESPLSSAGEGSHPPFLCSKSSVIGFNLQSMYIDRRAKSVRKNHSPNSYDADSDFVESPHSCHIPTSKSPSHTVLSHCSAHKSPEHMAVPSAAKYYKRDCQRDSERPLILKIKCDRSPLHKKSPIYFCENVTPTDSPPKLKLIDSEKNGHVFANENNCCRRMAKNVAEISDSNHKQEQTPSYNPDCVEKTESVTDRLCECDSANMELATSPNHSCDDAVLEEAAKVPRLNRQKSRRNSSRVCACCMSSPKRHRFKGEKRKRSLSTSNTPGSIIFTSGSTVHLKCDVTYMSPNEKKFVKSALNLSSLQQKLHILFIHLFPRLEPALLQMPPESLRFADMLDEVIKTLEASLEDEEQTDSEELSKQLLSISLKENNPTVTVFEPQVDLCKSPKDCLEEYQEKIYTLLKLLLPDLTMKYEYVLRFPKDLEKFLDRVLAWNYCPS